MPLPAFGQQDALQIRMSFEANAEHVIHFALQPVRRRPNGNRTWQRLAIGNQRLHPNAFVPRKRVENPDRIKRLFPLGIMHRGDVHAVIELFLITQHLKKFRNETPIDDKIVLPQIGARLADTRSKLPFEFAHHSRIPRNGSGPCRLGGRRRGVRRLTRRTGRGRGSWRRADPLCRACSRRSSFFCRWNRLNRTRRLFRRRFLFAIRRRWRTRLGFLGHSLGRSKPQRRKAFGER